MIEKLLPSIWRRSEAPMRRAEDQSPFFALQREMNRVFDDFFRGLDFSTFDRVGSFGSFTPSIDLRQDEKEVLIKAELPGLDEKDVEVTLTEDTLTIRGEKKEEKEEKEKGYWQRETRYGSFHRSIALPTGINTDKANARFKNGVLTVSLPLHEEAKAKEKKIKVIAA
jgi:HSP20 family protein